MSGLNIAWNSIRTLSGSQQKGFEELCCQLADAERPGGTSFTRTGAPDAGVECFAVHPDGTEWGWQAKYFLTALGDKQWEQIDKSVDTALNKHGRLVRYFVCIPQDRPDARVDGQRSALVRWDEHVRKWEGWAVARGMHVAFDYWGSHELLDRLVRPEHAGRVRFWFDVHAFDAAWFSARLEEALMTAGPRYAPKIHVGLPIAAEFEVFGRTVRFVDGLKAHGRRIRERLRVLGYSKTEVDVPTGASIDAVASVVQSLLAAIGELALPSAGGLDLLGDLATRVAVGLAACERLGDVLAARKNEMDAGSAASAGGSRHPRTNPFRDARYGLADLDAELRGVQAAVEHAERVAGNSVLLLTGDAGTGKTHLLCDVARSRLSEDRPTILLMGQQFIGAESPWRQALAQLDLAGLGADEFVGALEAAAEAAGHRALFIVDALNEGAGRNIWPNHLASFLVHLERSPWIGVVLAVRSSYEDALVPGDIRARAVRVVHRGFAGHEYDATRTFFAYYGLDLPTTPLLGPEFRNPLFLKTLCQGLKAEGERRLPRGFRGITATFEMFLNAINDRLASELGFDRKRRCVWLALESFAKAMFTAGERWLPRARAQDVVNALLPGRQFEDSLYRGLVAEGILVEEAPLRSASMREEIVFIAYDRLADHLTAQTLLDAHLDAEKPASAFGPGGPLAFLVDADHPVAPTLLEALCVQVPERCAQELTRLAPGIENRPGFGDAFRRSLAWRSPESLSDDTRAVLNELIREHGDLDDSLDVLLTVAAVPRHSLNAAFLDRRLRQDAMAARDAWWSTYLHRAWGTQSAVDRLVDWASSVTPQVALDEETVDLAATALSWMLTASNRFLRDRATKALVSLLTGRLEALARLVERFADVDDLYVAERIYAVAYGVVMRSSDPAAVGAVAAVVYARVFEGGAPPAHILLRDYARGVVERAICLGSANNVDAARIRPPYGSRWPRIPSEDDVKPLLPDWSRGSRDSGDTEWARNRIGSSVMDDDFARYVIGTNSSATSREWLAMEIGAPAWRPPSEHPHDELEDLIRSFSEAEKNAWTQYEAAERTEQEASRALIAEWIEQRGAGSEPEEDELAGVAEPAGETEDGPGGSVDLLRRARDEARAGLDAALTAEHARRLREMLKARGRHGDAGGPPRLDLNVIQRYILWRVFDLGWTGERFGHFDRFAIGRDGREASKAERIGKKYQWIAYHEIMALVADHFQYREQYRDEDGSTSYEGPWESGFRDIDPSCTLRAPAGGTSWDGHVPAWWASAKYVAWDPSDTAREWVIRYDDLPKVEELLSVARTDSAGRWLNMGGYFNWQQQVPADREPTEVDRRDLWYICTGYLIRAEDVEVFVKWAEGVDFLGRWMPDMPEVHQVFLGEHAWSPASRYFRQEYFGDPGWVQPRPDCPVRVRAIGVEYAREASGFDCSIDESYKLRLPTADLVAGLGLRWSGDGADYLDAAGRVAAFDPTVHEEGPSALLLREDALREYLVGAGLSVCWVVLGEKRVVGAGMSSQPHPELRLSGAYVLREGGPAGFLKCIINDPSDSRATTQLLTILRTGSCK